MVPKVILVYSVFLVLAQASPQFDFPSSSEEEVSDASQHQSVIRLHNPILLNFFRKAFLQCSRVRNSLERVSFAGRTARGIRRMK